MGRNKIKIQKIQNERNRIVTFVKRKKGLFKKAMELSLLCEAQIFVAVISKENQLSIVTTYDKPETFIEKHLHFPLQTSEKFTINDYSSLFISKDDINSISHLKETSTASTSKQNDNKNEQPFQCPHQFAQPTPSFVYVPYHQMNSAYLNMQNYYLLPQQQKEMNMPVSTTTTINSTYPMLLHNKRNRSDNGDSLSKCCVNNGNVTNIYNNYLHNSYNQ